MPSITVYNGDLDGALRLFKWKNADRVQEYQSHMVFTSPAEQRRKEERLAELRRKSREKRKKLRQELNRREGKDD